MEELKCTNCGGALKAGDKFCTNCGAPVTYYQSGMVITSLPQIPVKFETTCPKCNCRFIYTTEQLGYRQWYPSGFVYCPTCNTPIRRRNEDAIEFVQPDLKNMNPSKGRVFSLIAFLLGLFGFFGQVFSFTMAANAFGGNKVLTADDRAGAIVCLVCAVILLAQSIVSLVLRGKGVSLGYRGGLNGWAKLFFVFSMLFITMLFGVAIAAFAFSV